MEISQLRQGAFMPSLQLHIASNLLGHLLEQEQTRKLPDRMEDVQHAWDVAGALLQVSRVMEPSVDGGPSSPAAPALRPDFAIRTPIAVRRSIVDRNTLPLMPTSIEEWRANRAKKKPEPPEAGPRKGPTFR
jgi:hypothetical protein